MASERIISVLTKVFARFGSPKVLLSDNGPQFMSEEFESFLKLNGIQHCRTSPYFPTYGDRETGDPECKIP